VRRNQPLAIPPISWIWWFIARVGRLPTWLQLATGHSESQCRSRLAGHRLLQHDMPPQGTLATAASLPMLHPSFLSRSVSCTAFLSFRSPARLPLRLEEVGETTDGQTGAMVKHRLGNPPAVAQLSWVGPARTERSAQQEIECGTRRHHPAAALINASPIRRGRSRRPSL
jgi:hypothetical protein